MTKLKEREPKTIHEPSETFTLDGQFLKREAKEALKSYFIPFSGVYAAATGKKVIIVRDTSGRSRTKKKS